MATAAVKTRMLRTACDLCYKLKERCVRESAITVCTRCKRLGLICSTVRPVRPAGRRPGYQKSISESRSSSIASKGHAITEACDWLGDVPDHELPAEEKELMMFLLSRPENLEYLVMGPSFQVAEQRSLAAPLPMALPILKDAYLACARLLKSLHPGIFTEEEKNASFRHASLAMETLRSLPLRTPQDASLCLSLGMTLALFVYSAIGVGVADICHYCLSRTSLFVTRTIPPDPETETCQSFLVLLETMECLVYRHAPTLCIPLRISDRVDRHIGLCLPLLPRYYDLCVISHSLSNTTDESYLARIYKKLEIIQADIQKWIPSHPPHFLIEYNSTEIVNLLAQARVYRLAALLVAHRLRHGYGDEDAQADIWSKEIMMEFDLAQQITKQPIRCVTIPFVVAAVEVRATEARIKTLKEVENYVDKFSPVLQEATRSFLSKIWRERDLETTSCWFDSISKPCAVLNFADQQCFA